MVIAAMELIGNHIPKARAMSQHSEMGMFGRTPLPAPSSRSVGRGLSNAGPPQNCPQDSHPSGINPTGLTSLASGTTKLWGHDSANHKGQSLFLPAHPGAEGLCGPAGTKSPLEPH